MTIWDTIYKNKTKNGNTWAAPSDRFQPLFQHFLKESNFEIKHALDIGCGIGKYLKILQSEGFKTDGVDSSETAVKMAEELLGGDSVVFCADMFEFEIPENKYDLVISILTIHHGNKEQIQNLIDKIHEALAKDGKIFITLPDFKSNEKCGALKDYEKIAEGTYVPLTGPEKGLPHSFYTEAGIKNLFSEFKNLKLNLDDQGDWVVRAEK